MGLTQATFIPNRQSAQWGMYTPNQSYRHFLKSTKYVALTLEMAVVCYMLMYCAVKIGSAASEEKLFENVNGQMDDKQKVITIAHPEYSSDELTSNCK